ncbi:hypothetical protein SAMD00019534_025560, partial [Acytostelium subglobosum LB1]|uniref:hypothetical protein n=1 Tax=Acytostelium subglobosum LB1 TaxID=1410327 RepID=UPI0006447D71
INYNCTSLYHSASSLTSSSLFVSDQSECCVCVSTAFDYPSHPLTQSTPTTSITLTPAHPQTHCLIIINSASTNQPTALPYPTPSTSYISDTIVVQLHH